jgi:mannose-1-phosphate guanylyltransferase
MGTLGVASLLRRRAARGTRRSAGFEDHLLARAMILAAGLGTRLRPLTTELPKPLVPLGDRPIVSHIAARLAAAGFSELVMNTHHDAEKFSSQIHHLGLTVHLVHEPEIRGTAGGIAGCRAHFGPAPIVVWNGDIIADPPIVQLLARAGDGLALAVAPRPRAEGTLGVDGAGRIVRLRGETFGAEVAGADYIGVAAIGASVLAALPAEGCLITDCALPILRRGEAVRTVLTTEAWTDIGSIRAYHDASIAWVERIAGPGGSWVHPRSTVGSAVALRTSIVGEGARLDGKGTVERCVLWPGARVTAPLRDTIVTTLGRQVSAR